MSESKPWKWEVTPAEQCWRIQNYCWTLTRLGGGPWSFSTRPVGESVAWTGRAAMEEASLRRGRTNTGNLTPRWSPSSRVFLGITALDLPRERIRSRGDRAALGPVTANRASSTNLEITKVDFSYRGRGWSYRFTPTPGDEEPAPLLRSGGDRYAKVFLREFLFFNEISIFEDNCWG